MHHAQIAMHRTGGIEHIGPGAGAVKRAGNFLADVGRFTHASDGNAASAEVGGT